jgi:hypothetical protein
MRPPEKPARGQPSAFFACEAAGGEVYPERSIVMVSLPNHEGTPAIRSIDKK